TVSRYIWRYAPFRNGDSPGNPSPNKKRAISPGSSISGRASRGNGKPVGARVVGIFALISFQRPSRSRPNFSSLRARFTWSSTNWLYVSTDSTTCPSLLISFLSNFYHSERSRGISYYFWYRKYLEMSRLLST